MSWVCGCARGRGQLCWQLVPLSRTRTRSRGWGSALLLPWDQRGTPSPAVFSTVQGWTLALPLQVPCCFSYDE